MPYRSGLVTLGDPFVALPASKDLRALLPRRGHDFVIALLKHLVVVEPFKRFLILGFFPVNPRLLVRFRFVCRVHYGSRLRKDDSFTPQRFKGVVSQIGASDDRFRTIGSV